MRAQADKLSAVRFHAMGSVVLAAGRDGGIQPYWRKPLVCFFQSVERTASRFMPDSELSRFNRAPMFEPVRLSSMLYEMVRLAWEWSGRTQGLFQPLVGSDLCRLGYDRPFERLKEADAGRPPVASDFGRDPIPDTSDRDFRHALTLNDEEQTAARNTPLQLDLGGIGKGWSADRAAGMMRYGFHVERGVIDAGGDMRVWTDGEPWLIGVQDPFDEEKELLQLVLTDAALATSNILHRRWVCEGRWVHHILNGRTGFPAETDIVQATVLAPSVAEAEVAAKIICMAGTEHLSEWMKAYFPACGYIAVTRTGEIKINRRVYDYAERIVV
mgnify:FL=1